MNFAPKLLTTFIILIQFKFKYNSDTIYNKRGS